MLTFIVNPNSGGEKGYSTWKIAERYLKKKGIPYYVHITGGPGDCIPMTKQACRDAAGQHLTLVPVGGDGTFSDVINAINTDDDITLGYIPTGSGNDLARGLGFSTNTIKNLERILDCKKIYEMDYGVMTYGDKEVLNRRFAVSCGIGYDAAVCVAIDNSNLRRQLSKVKAQKSVYLLLGALEILKSKASRGYIILDGKKKVEFNDIMFVSAQNHRTEGGNKNFAPKAIANDGLLTLCIMHNKSKLGFTKTLFSGIKGNHLKLDGVRAYDCRSVKIHVDTPFSVHCDGEVFPPQTDIELHIVERKLKVII